jgi:hypothetical protein
LTNEMRESRVMRIILIDDVKNVQSFKSGYELVEYEAGTDPLGGFCLMGFDEVGMFCTNPKYAFVESWLLSEPNNVNGQ